MRLSPTRTAVAVLLSSALLTAQSVLPAHAQQQTSPPQSSVFTLKVNSNIVLTNVIVRDRKSGAVIKDLKPLDFSIFENGKPQKLESFDFQSVDQAIALHEKDTVSGRQTVAQMLNGDSTLNAKDVRDHRLIVLFFDLSSMQPEDIDRAVESAQHYIHQQMQAADLVSLVSLSTGLSLDQDFTSDKAALLKTLASYNGTEGQGYTAGGTTGSTDATADDASSFAADDSEYASLNTDRELYAIQQISKSLARVDARKSMLYFSGGLTRNGIENQSSLRSATNAAAKANLAIYSVDTRGLQALPPVGDASQGSLRGNAAYSGAAVQTQLSGNFASQETLATLSTDTGGKSFFDSNDFAPAFQQVQHDTQAYYILGFRSSNQKRDGSFRHLTIKLNRKDAKLEYRPGYYAPADFQHSGAEDREQALTDQLRSDLPATDVAVYLQALFFRLADNRYFIPVSLVVPGSQIPFLKNGDRSKASIDIAGQVKDAEGIVVGNVRETVKLALNAAQQVERRNIQYSTGFTLAPGHYHLKFVVRENQTGLMGSFETDLNVPDLKRSPLKLSSVVLASQRIPDAQKNPVSPLVRDGLEWVPNVAHVFRQDQHLYFLYEVYDPAHRKSGAKQPVVAAGLGRRPAIGGIRVLTSIEFMLNGVKVYETPLVEADQINTPGRGAVAFQFDVPLDQLQPGTYLCQVNVIDDTGAAFSFPRLALRIAPPPAIAQTAAHRN